MSVIVLTTMLIIHVHYAYYGHYNDYYGHYYGHYGHYYRQMCIIMVTVVTLRL